MTTVIRSRPSGCEQTRQIPGDGPESGGQVTSVRLVGTVPKEATARVFGQSQGAHCASQPVGGKQLEAHGRIVGPSAALDL